MLRCCSCIQRINVYPRGPMLCCFFPKGGAIALVTSATKGSNVDNDDGANGSIEWFTKSHDVYGSAPTGSDDDYYLNLTKAAAISSTTDLLGIHLLSGNYSEITWNLVESAVPPIRNVGVRAFVGSRGSVADTTFNNAGEDALGYGFPPPLGYVFNLTNIAEGGAALPPASEMHVQEEHRHESLDSKLPPYINKTLMAAGLVGGHLPVAVFYFPVAVGSPYLPNGTSARGNRYCARLPPATLLAKTRRYC